jgi:hypothetical protein
VDAILLSSLKTLKTVEDGVKDCET